MSGHYEREIVHTTAAGRFAVHVAVVTEQRFGAPPLAMVEIQDHDTGEIVLRPVAYPDAGDGRELAKGAARLIGKSVRAVACHIRETAP